MEITLEKIELVKDRTGVSYKEAKDALEKSEGNVVDAIILIEQSIDEAPKGFGKAGEAADKIKEIVKKGNVSRIRIMKDEEVIINLPVTLGIAGTVLFPWAMIGSVITAFGTKCKIELVKDDGTVVDVSEKAQSAVDAAKTKGGVIVDEVKDKSGDVFDAARTKGGELFEKAKEKAAELKNKGEIDSFDLSDLNLDEMDETTEEEKEE